MLNKVYGNKGSDGQGGKVGQGKVQRVGKGGKLFVGSQQALAENFMRIRRELRRYHGQKKYDRQTKTQKIFVLITYGFKRTKVKDWMEANEISQIRSQ